MDLAEELEHARERIAALEAEAARLRGKANLLDTFIQRTPAAVAMFDTAMRYLAYSDRWLTDYHLDRQDLHGRSHYEVFPEIPERWKEIHRKVLAGTALRATEDRFERADGSVDWVTWECVPWYDAPGHISGIIMFTEVVTERVQAREALRQTEEKYRRLYDSMMDAFIGVDMFGHIMEFNQAFQHLLGYTAEELRHLRYTDLTPAERHAGERTIIEEQVLPRGYSDVFEDEFIRKDGTTVPVELRALLLHDAEGRPESVWAIARDITERKQAEAELQRSQQYLWNILDSFPGVVFWKDRHSVYLGCNRAFAEGAGLTDPLQIVGKTDYDLPWGPYEADAYRADDRQVMESGKAKLGIVETQRQAGGHIAWFETNKVPLYDADGAVIGVFGTSADITKRKKMEQALEEERALLSTGIDILPFPIIFGSATGEILRVNRAAEALWDAQRTERLDAPQGLLVLDPGTRRVIPVEDWPERRALHGEVIASAEYLLVMPDGSEMAILAQAAPIYVKNELIGTVLALQDISKLKEADRAKDQFLMVLSHELKTPLTSILGWAQAALSTPETAPQALGIIVRNAQEQSRILDDLLDVSRLVTGRLSLRTERHDLWELACLSAESVRQLAQSQGLTLHEEPPATPVPVLADAARLRQAIGNLLTNAIKYTEAGGDIWVRVFRRDDMAVLEVQDTGRGISPENLAALFRPFLQIHREEQKGGMGLGLSLVKGIVELHGGHVTAASPGPGKGSTFTIDLPLAPSPGIQ